ncbi:MAG: CinA family protein [Lachnospiraceae bacterium]|nr:CinA family protein [Lachnospiraceae bacterium]
MIMDFTEIRKKYEDLTCALIEKKLTITTMESATAGQIASLITDTEGSSAIIKGACITYSNEAKILEGVPAETIHKYSVYSEETARAMAEVCRKKYHANIGVGVTGTMGNVDPANAASSVPGQVYFAISYDGEITSYYEELLPMENRLAYKMAVADLVVDKLNELLADK